MKRTLLDLTQNILNSLSSDEVNSISDTTESLQVAEIIKTVYFNIVARSDLTLQEELFQLTASGNVLKPTLMTVPSNISEIDWIKYSNTSVTPTEYDYVTVLAVQEFIDMVDKFNPTDTTVGSMSVVFDGPTFTFQYKNNKQPQFCTVIENAYVIFDSYDVAKESTLQTSKTRCWGQVLPTWSNIDSYVPELDDNQFPLLLNEAKSLAFFELKQQPHSKAEQESKRQWGALQRTKALSHKPTYFDALPNFGRTGRGFQSAVSPFKQRGWDN